MARARLHMYPSASCPHLSTWLQLTCLEHLIGPILRVHSGSIRRSARRSDRLITHLPRELNVEVEARGSPRAAVRCCSRDVLVVLLLHALHCCCHAISWSLPSSVTRRFNCSTVSDLWANFLSTPLGPSSPGLHSPLCQTVLNNLPTPDLVRTSEPLTPLLDLPSIR